MKAGNMSVRRNTSPTNLPPAAPNPLASPRHSASGENLINKASPKAQTETGIEVEML